jgi:subtilisin family serine protease
MASGMTDEDSLPLAEFVKLPTTVDFQVIDTDRFRLYASDKPYLHFGTELANNYVVVYTNEKYIQGLLMELGSNFLSFYPKILSPLDSQSNDVAGITQTLNQPFLDLTGRGVIIGIVDTGIDYTKNAFRFEDGSTKILDIWDQSLDGARPDDLYFGSVYDREKINEALASDRPHSVVPTIDEDGHGTFLASVAAGNEKGEYTGAAPKANIIAVKLKRARTYYIDRYLLSQDDPNLYESSDYLLGIKYILDRSEELNMPVVICMGMGSNSSAHDGNTLFEDYVSFVSQRVGYAFVIAAGNEANARHHTQGTIQRGRGTDTISIKVGQQGASFSVVIFGPAFDKVSLGVISPTGEVLPRIPFKSGLEYSEKLVLEDTTLYLKYFKDVNNNLIIGFHSATEGIWDIKLFGDSIVSGEYWAWLPVSGQVSDSVEFLKPVPEYTIVYPATAARAIVCGAYDSDDNSLFVSSSWGPTRVPRMAPDFVAPGVSVKGVYPTGYGTMTGTSVAAAVTAGAAALLMEWGIVQKNMTAINGELVRSLLISGCTRDNNLQYPNIKWGYGKLNLSSTFSSISETVVNYNMEG